jgi:gliding motility-associated-like protein
MKVINKLKVLAFATIAFGFANSSYGQAALGAPNFNFENGSSSDLTTGPSTSAKWYGWQYYHSSVSGSDAAYNWGTWTAINPNTQNDNAGGLLMGIETNPNAYAPQTGNGLKVSPDATRYPRTMRINGQSSSNGSYDGSCIVYPLTVTGSNCLLTFYYAMVLQNPGHDGRPRFEIDVMKQNTSTMYYGADSLISSCAKFVEIGNTTLAVEKPDIWTNTNNWIWSKWQKVTLYLGAYTGLNVLIRVRLGDCTAGGHGSFGYFVGEVKEPRLDVNLCSSTPNVLGTIEATGGFLSYEWYKNPAGDPPSVALSNGTAVPVNDGDNIDSILNVTSDMLDNQFQMDFFVKMTSPSTGSGTPSCEGYLTTTVSDGKPRPNIQYSTQGTPEVKLHNLTDQTATRMPTECEWSFGDGSPNVIWQTGDDSTLWSPTHTFPQCGQEYDVTLKALRTLDNGDICEAISTRKVIVPCLNVSPDDTICIGDTFTAFADTTGSNIAQMSIIWQKTNGDTLSLNPSYTANYNTKDTLIATVTVIQQSSTQTTYPKTRRDTVIVSVQDFPDIDIQGDTILCLGETANISAIDNTGAVVRMKWVYYRPVEPYDLTGGTTSPQLPAFIPTKDTVVYLLAETSKGCIVWDSITIRIVNPVVHSNTLKVCPGQEVTLWGTDAENYSWSANPADATLPTGNADTIKVTPANTTTYTMAGYGSSGCHADRFITIEVIPYPVATIDYTPSYVDVSSPVVSFVDNSPYSATSHWDFSDGGSSNARSISYKFTDASADSVWIRLTSYNELGCSDDTTIYLPIMLFAVYVPTAFSPDGDGLNDLIFFQTSNELFDVKFEIFNRWGTIVYSFYADKYDPVNLPSGILGWDGKLNGSDAPQGTYIYRLQYKMQGSTRTYDKSGTLNLIK